MLTVVASLPKSAHLVEVKAVLTSVSAPGLWLHRHISPGNWSEGRGSSVSRSRALRSLPLEVVVSLGVARSTGCKSHDWIGRAQICGTLCPDPPSPSLIICYHLQLRARLLYFLSTADTSSSVVNILITAYCPLSSLQFASFT